MREIGVRFVVRESKDGWRLFAAPTNGSGWAPIPVTKVPRGTPGGALTEFAMALYRLSEEPTPSDAVDPVGERVTDSPRA